MIEQIEQLMSLLELQTVAMKNMVDTLKICGCRIAQLEQEVDDLKVIVNANIIVKQ